jgi:RimJ/RimL family protein N-acetyltransferase
VNPVLETARLILRPPIETDLDAWATLDADETATRHIGGPKNRAQAWLGLAAAAGMWSLRGCGLFSVIEKASGRWIGRIGPWLPEDAIGTEIGWAVLPAAQGQGYAVEGADAAMCWTFEALGWTEVIHCIDADNLPSIAVARRLGARWLRAEGAVQVYGQTRDQWQSTAR